VLLLEVLLLEVLLTQYFSGDQIEKNEIAGSCSTYGDRKVVYCVLVGKPEGKNHLEDPGMYI
jgi:hypothetical protein